MQSPVNIRFALLFFIVALATASSNKAPSNDDNNKAIKSLETTLAKKLDQIIAVMNASSRGQPNIGPGKRSLFTANALWEDSCVPVYGLGACGGGGWTLVMKIDGSKPTFHFKSKLWTNNIDFNLPGGKTLFDNHETKLPTYWNIPFSKICLGMRFGQQTKFLAINKHANSLYSLIADGKYRNTLLGRNRWKTLLGTLASLHANCNMEGSMLSVVTPEQESVSLVTIKMTATVVTPESGLVLEDILMTPTRVETRLKHGGDNGNKHIKVMGYILVQ